MFIRRAACCALLDRCCENVFPWNGYDVVLFRVLKFPNDCDCCDCMIPGMEEYGVCTTFNVWLF